MNKILEVFNSLEEYDTWLNTIYSSIDEEDFYKEYYEDSIADTIIDEIKSHII